MSLTYSIIATWRNEFPMSDDKRDNVMMDFDRLRQELNEILSIDGLNNLQRSDKEIRRLAGEVFVLTAVLNALLCGLSAKPRLALVEILQEVQSMVKSQVPPSNPWAQGMLFRLDHFIKDLSISSSSGG